jgi:NIMA (never in mitosis gene a)-related kinase
MYTLKEKIGEGSYGSVFKVERRGRNYAMKKLNIENIKPYEKKCIVSELKILSCHKCDFLLKYYNTEIVGKHICIYTEYIQGGDLSKQLENHIKNKSRFENETLKKYFVQLCIALEYLHTNNIIHRDIKPANVLITNNADIKLIDFGVSKICDKYLKYTKTFIGTPYYIAPEQFRNVNYNHKVDIWSLGCLFFELCEHKLPFKGNDLNELRVSVLRGLVIFSHHTSDEFKLIIKKCLTKSHYSRPEAQWLSKQFSYKLKTQVMPIVQIIVPVKKFNWIDFIKSLPSRRESIEEKQESDYQDLVHLPKLQLMRMIANLRKEINDIKNKNDQSHIHIPNRGPLISKAFPPEFRNNNQAGFRKHPGRNLLA